MGGDMATMSEPTDLIPNEYHAEARLLSGHMRLPLELKIDAKGVVVLQGERDQSIFRRSGPYDAEGLISFRAGYTRVSGSHSREHGWLTLSTAVLEGLNVLDVVTADRVVAQVATERSGFDGLVPGVTFLGTRFENLRIGGYPVELEVDLGICGPKPGGGELYSQQLGLLDRARRQSERIVSAGDVRSYVRDQYDLELSNIDGLRKHPPQNRKGHESNIRLTLVNHIAGPAGTKSIGNILDVPDFGTISLAVVEILESWREEFGVETTFVLNMLDVKMGSIANGDLRISNCIVGGGTRQPTDIEPRRQDWRPPETYYYAEQVSHEIRPGQMHFDLPTVHLDPSGAHSSSTAHAEDHEQEFEARFVNVCMTEGPNRGPIPKSQSLRPGGRYDLQVDIGPWSSNSAVENPVPVPTEKLPPSQEGHWLEVIAASDDFRLELRRYDIFLPRVGASFSCGCEPGSLHKCKQSERQTFLYIPVVAPGLRDRIKRGSPATQGQKTDDTYRSARLRLAIYFQKNLVQSLLLTATISPMNVGDTGYSLRVDYSLTADLSDVSFLPERTLNILTNDNVDGSHRLIINSDIENPISLTLNDEKMGRAIDAARETLTNISVMKYGGQLGAKIQYGSRYQKDNTKSREDFIADLKTMAPLGWKLWTSLFQAQPKVRAALSARLRGAPVRPATIQVSRAEDSFLAFPWAFIYDIPLETDKSRHTLCPSLENWGTSETGVPDRCPFEDKHPRKNVLCPFGFWGFSHIIEQPPSMPTGRALPIVITRAAAHAKAQLVMGISLDLDAAVTRSHLDKLGEKLGAFQLIPRSSRDEVETALGQEDLEMVYFYCHGRREPVEGTKDTTPYIEVGKKEGIAPGDITAWDTADWNEAHWRKTSPLIFINGCHTAELTPDLLVNFVDSFVGVYAAGVIGTEILLLQEVASEAAEMVLVAMNSKDPKGEFIGVGHAIRQMRLHFLGKGNLLGLAYTPYCSADLKLSN
jgi:hypothetical protein